MCIQILEECTQHKGFLGYRRVCALCNDHTHAFSFQIEHAEELGCQLLKEMCNSSSDGEGYHCQSVKWPSYQLKVGLTLPACEFGTTELAEMWFLVNIYQWKIWWLTTTKRTVKKSLIVRVDLCLLRCWIFPKVWEQTEHWKGTEFTWPFEEVWDFIFKEAHEFLVFKSTFENVDPKLWGDVNGEREKAWGAGDDDAHVTCSGVF